MNKNVRLVLNYYAAEICMWKGYDGDILNLTSLIDVSKRDLHKDCIIPKYIFSGHMM